MAAVTICSDFGAQKNLSLSVFCLDPQKTTMRSFQSLLVSLEALTLPTNDRFLQPRWDKVCLEERLQILEERPQISIFNHVISEFRLDSKESVEEVNKELEINTTL